MDLSIGTNMMECGEAWRMGREHLEPLARAGVECVDVHMGARYEAVDGPEPLRRASSFVDFADDRHPTQIRQWLDELGLRAVCMHTAPMGLLDLASPDEAVRAFSARELALAPAVCRALGVSVMVVHPGEHKQGTGLAECFDQLTRSLASVLPAAERHSIRVALENLLPGSSSARVETLVEHVDRIGHPLVGICLDTGHANVTGHDLGEAVRAIGPRLFALHVHDNSGERDEHNPPFTGTIDWTGFADALADAGYAGTLNLEVVDRQGGAPASVEFIRNALAAARRVLARA